MNRIVIFISTLAFQKCFLFKILKLFQYIFSHLNLIPIFFSNTWKIQSLASFSPQGIFFKFYYLECFRKFKILNFFQLFCSISWSWFLKKILALKLIPPIFFKNLNLIKKKIHEFEIYSKFLGKYLNYLKIWSTNERSYSYGKKVTTTVTV